VIVGSIVLVGSTMIAGDVEGVAVGNDDGDSVVGTDEVQATRISRINNQKNERIKQTSYLGVRASGPRCTICEWNLSFPQAPRKHASRVRGPLARVVRSAVGTHRFPRPPANTLRWVRGPPARVVQVAAGTDHFPRSPTHLYHLSPHPTAPVRRMVGPSTMGQK